MIASIRLCHENSHSAYHFYDGRLIPSDDSTLALFLLPFLRKRTGSFRNTSPLQHNQIRQLRDTHRIVQDQVAIWIEEIFVALSEMVRGVKDEK